jgi:hypothetical protein
MGHNQHFIHGVLFLVSLVYSNIDWSTKEVIAGMHLRIGGVVINWGKAIAKATYEVVKSIAAWT